MRLSSSHSLFIAFSIYPGYEILNIIQLRVQKEYKQNKERNFFF